MHTIVLPYHFDREVKDFLRILAQISSLDDRSCDYRFLLAASCEREVSQSLHDAAAQLAPTESIRCPTHAVGYPEGATGMFWDSMDWAARNPSDGFVLWLESDMCPVRKDWLLDLDSDWSRSRGVLLMGCLIPEIETMHRKPRLFRRAGYVTVPQHVNGGACYRHDFANHIPDDLKHGAFDVSISEYLSQFGGYADTPAIRLATIEEVRGRSLRPDVAIVHGFLQDKSRFLDACLETRSQQRDIINPKRAELDSAEHRHLREVRREIEKRPSLLTVYVSRSDLDLKTAKASRAA